MLVEMLQLAIPSLILSNELQHPYEGGPILVDEASNLLENKTDAHHRCAHSQRDDHYGAGPHSTRHRCQCYCYCYCYCCYTRK